MVHTYRPALKLPALSFHSRRGSVCVIKSLIDHKINTDGTHGINMHTNNLIDTYLICWLHPLRLDP
jgi:hypothetical protein